MNFKLESKPIASNNSMLLSRITGRHRLTDDDKRHRCTFCPMKFFKKDKLTRHIRTHTGEKRNLFRTDKSVSNCQTFFEN